MKKVLLFDVNGVIQAKGTLKGLLESDEYNWPF